MSEKKKFKTEIQQLLDLVIHSLYSNKDIFLRELIANSADALDKARFEALTKPEISKEWEIRIIPNKEEKTLTIIDNGIGMNKDEVITNIGTIAKSGTKAFLAELKEKQSLENNPDLIGQFGVGFYSSFMVADKVILETKRAGEDSPAIKWESAGNSGYILDETEKEEQGTTVTLFLKEEYTSYLEEWKIKEIVKKYSDFIEHPVVLQTETEKDGKKESNEEIINTRTAIWLRAPSEISEDDHNNFFAHLDAFGGEPLKHIHFSAEGMTEFKALLYIPSKSGFNLFMPEQRKHGLHLYVKRVFITDECKELIPEYLRFVKGVVDSNDLPLNISREILQDNPLILKINKNIVRKILSELKKLKNTEPEKYLEFHKEFGTSLKEGIHSDLQNQEKLQDLVMFQTLNNEPGKYIFLEDYCREMPEDQKHIYYISGESREMIEKSPHLELLRSKGYDVLMMLEPIDEFVVQAIPKYKDKELKAVGKGELDLGDQASEELKKKKETAQKKYKSLLDALKSELDENIKEVRFSTRLTESPCCLVNDTYDPSPNMEKIFKALNKDMPTTKRILELNPDHPLISGLENLFESNKDKFKEFASLLYDQALLIEGATIPDPADFAKKLTGLMLAGIEK
jgi:molecular chaperone HtpG